MRLAILADTHLPRGARRLPEACLRELEAADLIIHLGDFNELAVLRHLESLGPVEAVRGNVDSPQLRRLLPAHKEIEVDDVRLALIHDAGPARGRMARMRRRFPEADAVLFGHSHLPLLEGDGEFQLFNPGSPTERRRAETRSMGRGEITEGRLALRHVLLS